MSINLRRGKISDLDMKFKKYKDNPTKEIKESPDVNDLEHSSSMFCNLPLTPLIVNEIESPFCKFDTRLAARSIDENSTTDVIQENFMINSNRTFCTSPMELSPPEQQQQQSKTTRQATISTKTAIQNSKFSFYPPKIEHDITYSDSNVISPEGVAGSKNRNEYIIPMEMESKTTTTNSRSNWSVCAKLLIGLIIFLILLLLAVLIVLMIKSEHYDGILAYILVVFIFIVIIVSIIALACVYYNNNKHKNTENTNSVSIHNKPNQMYVATRSHAPTPHSRRRRNSTHIRTWSKGDLLGCGSFGKVYMALDHDSGQVFVVKQVPLIKDTRGKQLFSEQIDCIRQEIKTLQKISHPNIVRYLGSSKTTNHLNIFLEFLSGGSVAGMLHSFKVLDISLIRSYTCQILCGLTFLHENGIIHRDIKGSNILVSSDGCVKLGDFGAAKNLHEVSSSTSSLHGTAHWCAPEVISQKSYDYSADIWSLGITIIEMATGKPPWYNKDPISVMYLISNLTNKSIFEQIPTQRLGKHATQFVKACLQFKPEERPTAKELLTHPFITEPITDNVDETSDNDIDSEEESELQITRNISDNTIPNRYSVSKKNKVKNNNNLMCIADVKQLMQERLEYQNKARKQLLERKYKREELINENKKKKPKRMSSLPMKSPTSQ